MRQGRPGIDVSRRLPGARRRGAKRGERLRVVATVFAAVIVAALVLSGVLPVVLDFASRGAAPAAPAAPTATSSALTSEYEQDLRAALAERPDDPQLMVSLANLLVALDRWDEAREWFERSLEIEPDRLRTRLDFGLALSQRGAAADAEIQFQRALTIDATSAEAHLLLGELYLNWVPTRREDAVAAFTAAIAAQPESVPALRAREYLDQLDGGTPLAAG